jgi:anti-anti-sigma factor
MASHFAVKRHQERDGTIMFFLMGELDMAVAPHLRDQLWSAVEGDHRVVVDLRGLSFIDSSGLRLLVSADARAQKRGARVAFVRGRAAVHRVFEITAFDQVLVIDSDPPELFEGSADVIAGRFANAGPMPEPAA